MFTLFDWGFRLALILPWVAIVISVLSLLVPTRRKEELPVTRRAAA